MNQFEINLVLYFDGRFIMCIVVLDRIKHYTVTKYHLLVNLL
jgi:hypothetical protein